MESMTGYAYVESSTEQFSFSVEIKSLNSKFLEIYTDLPRILQKDENEIKDRLKEKLNRGKITLTIEIFDWTKERAVSIDEDLLKKYYAQLKNIESELGLKNFFSGDLIFTLDNVIRRERTSISVKSREDLFNIIEAAVDMNLKMREKEGNAVKKDVLKILGDITEALGKIKSLSKEVGKAQFKRLKHNIEAISNSEISDVRLLSEIAILADKLDINEEVVRLKDHLKKTKSTLNQRDQIGKKLDFLAQEMFREINTISSKANSSAISHLTVEMKNNIDKIREHCRNIV